MSGGRHWPGIVAALCLATVSFFWFPGHTILQSDTQIYIPVMEHMADPSVLSRDIMAVRPHVSFTLYDEVGFALRRATGLSFEHVLLAQLFIYRTIGIYGLCLLSSAAGLPFFAAVGAAAIMSLGAVVAGPTVLTVEYEPVPRAFALPFVLLSVGLFARGRTMPAAVAASVGWLLHPTTVMPYWMLLFGIIWWQSRWRELLVLLAAPVLLVLTLPFAPSSPEQQPIFAQLDAATEALQRMRASYGWVDTWAGRYWKHYILLAVAAAASLWTLRDALRREVVGLLAALAAIGVLSVPLSWILLEQLRWALMPQYQPGRYLMYVTLVAIIGCTVGGARAAAARNYAVAAFFFFVPLALALEPDLFDLRAMRLGLAVALAAVCAFLRRGPLPALASVLALLLIPTVGKVVNAPSAHTPEMHELVEWAKTNTPQDALFQFADVRRGLEPGIFRARALRAIYADWKAGGQVNFMLEFAKEWNDRWRRIERPRPLAFYRDLGIDYVVFSNAKAPPGSTPVYRNARWSVYRVTGPPAASYSAPCTDTGGPSRPSPCQARGQAVPITSHTL